MTTPETPPVVTETPPPVEPPVEMVPISELEKHVKMIKELEARENSAREALKAREMSDLQKNAEWQKVAEIKEKESIESKNKYNELKEAMVRREKYNALVQAALAGGILPEARGDLAHIDLKEMKIDTNDEGDFSVIGADKLVQKLKTLKPHWFKSLAPNINPTTPSATSSSAASSWDNLKKLEAAWKKTNSKADEAAYRDALLAMKKG